MPFFQNSYIFIYPYSLGVREYTHLSQSVTTLVISRSLYSIVVVFTESPPSSENGTDTTPGETSSNSADTAKVDTDKVADKLENLTVKESTDNNTKASEANKTDDDKKQDTSVSAE